MIALRTEFDTYPLSSSGRVLAVEVDRTRINPQFLAAWLRSEVGATSRLRAIEASSSGSNFKALRSQPKALIRRMDDVMYVGNVELCGMDPETFRYSILRVFDPATSTRAIDEAESHFKNTLDTRKHGLNRNWIQLRVRGPPYPRYSVKLPARSTQSRLP